MAGLLDSIMPAFLAPTKPETPYSGNNGLFGLFGDGTAGRLGLAGAAIGNLAVGKPFDTSAGLMALNEKEMSRKELERKYKAAMRYADKIQESNPDYADQIRTDWTLASFIQQEKLKNDLDPTKAALADKYKAETAGLNQRKELLDSYLNPGADAAGAPGTPPAGAVGSTSPLPAAAGGGATPATVGGTPPDTPAPPAPAPQQASNPFMERYKQMTGLEDLRPDEAEMIKRAELAALLDNENDFSKVNTAVKTVQEMRQARIKFEQEQLDYREGRANATEKLQLLRATGNYSDNQLRVYAGNNEKLNKEFDRVTQQESSNERVAQLATAGLLEGIDPGVLRLISANENLVNNLVQRQIDNSQPGSPGYLRNKLFNQSMGVNLDLESGEMNAKIENWSADEKGIKLLEEELGVKGLTRAEARRIYNSPDPFAEAGKVREEKRTDASKKKDTAMKLRDDYKKSKEANTKVLDITGSVINDYKEGALTIEALEKNPARGLQIMYQYIKALDYGDSAVREGEIHLAGSMTTMKEAWMETVKRTGLVYKDGKIQNPQVITPRVAQLMANQMIRMGNDAARKLEKLDKEYVETATDYDVDPKLVVGNPPARRQFDPGNPDDWEGAGQGAPADLSPEEMEAMRQGELKKQREQSTIKSGTGYD